MANFLVVVDMQNDFITGCLGNDETKRIVPAVCDLINDFKKANNFEDEDACQGRIFYTMDTHKDNYLSTKEGEKLPIKHCIYGTDGWRLNKEVKEAMGRDGIMVVKETFGAKALPYFIEQLIGEPGSDFDGTITLCGVCTDICVISNAMLLKAYFPNAEIKVKANCCAGASIESHNRALEAMKVCHIDIE